jgi:hypothetical protein
MSRLRVRVRLQVLRELPDQEVYVVDGVRMLKATLRDDLAAGFTARVDGRRPHPPALPEDVADVSGTLGVPVEVDEDGSAAL